MTLSCDGGLFYGNGVTYGALLTVGKAGSGTGCRGTCYGNLSVTLSCNGSLLDDNKVTYGAVCTCGKTCLGTGCLNGSVGNDSVTKNGAGIDYGVGSSTASVTGSGLSAVCGTGCVVIGNVVSIGVTKRGACINYGMSLVAALVVTLSGLSAVGGTGCVVVGYVVSEGVSGRSGLVCYGVGSATASVTGSSLSAADLTGCVAILNVVGEDVTEHSACINVGVGLATAVVTLSGLSTLSVAGCIAVGYVVSEGVSGCRADVSYSVGCATAVVTLSGLSAVGGTGCVAIGYVVSKGVSEDSALSLYGVGFATAIVTGSGLSAVSGAGCVAVVDVVGEAMLTGNSYVATDITGCVLAVRVGVLALNGKSAKDLSSDVLVAKLCICHINVVNVLILCCIVERIERGDSRDKSEYVVNVYVLAAKSYNLVKSVVNNAAVFNGNTCEECGGKSYENGVKLCGNSGSCCIAECTDNLGNGEGKLVYEELVVKIVAVVVTKSSNGRLGVNRNDGLHGLSISNIVGDELVKCGACRDVKNLIYRKLDSVVSVISKLCVEIILLNIANEISHAERICVGVKKINNVYGVAYGCGNTCVDDSIGDSSLKLINIRKIFLANKACPVKGVNLCACKVGCKNAVDSAVKSGADLCDTCGSKDTGECVCNISVKACAKRGVSIYANCAERLAYCIVERALAAVSNGDKVCASDVCYGNLVNGNLLILISAKVKSLCNDISIAVVGVNDSEVEEVLGKLDVAYNEICDVVINSIDKLCDSNVIDGDAEVHTKDLVKNVYDARNSCVCAVNDALDSLNGCLDALDRGVNGCKNLVKSCLRACDGHLNCCDCRVKISLYLCDSCGELCLYVSDCRVKSCLNVSDCCLKVCIDSTDSCLECRNVCRKLCVDSRDCSLKLCLNSCDLSKDSLSCLANSSHKLVVKGSKLSLCLCGKSVDSSLCLSLKRLDLGDKGVDLCLCLCLKSIDLILCLCLKSIDLILCLCLKLCDLIECAGLKLENCGLEGLLCVLDSSCKLCLNVSDCCCKLCLYSCDLEKDCLSCLAGSGHKLVVKNGELCLCLCGKSRDLSISLSGKGCDNAVDILACVKRAGGKKVADGLYVNCKSVKKVESLYVGLSVKLVSNVDKCANLCKSCAGGCEGLGKLNCELCASEVLGVLSHPSLSVVNSSLYLVEVCVYLVDNACLKSLVVCDLVSLVVVLLDKVCNDLEILNGLVLCGVAGLVSLYDSLKEIVVACGSGVNGHTVTNLKECIYLNHCSAGLCCIEPAAKSLTNSERSGRTFKLFGHIAKSFKNITGCNTHKTVNGNIKGINVHSDRILDCKIDRHRNFCFNIKAEEFLVAKLTFNLAQSVGVPVEVNESSLYEIHTVVSNVLLCRQSSPLSNLA